MEQKVKVDENGKLVVYTTNSKYFQNGDTTAEIKGEFTIQDVDLLKILTILNEGKTEFSCIEEVEGSPWTSYFKYYFGLKSQNEMLSNLQLEAKRYRLELEHSKSELEHSKSELEHSKTELEELKKRKYLFRIK